MLDLGEGLDERWTPLGVRLRRVTRGGSDDQPWLFFPGGPGWGSESLIELVDIGELPGPCWLVDLPGDGTNVQPRGAPTPPYVLWPHVLLEAVAIIPGAVVVGHSLGGEFLLRLPDLESQVRGLVLISSAPDSAGRSRLSTPVLPPGYSDAAERYEASPSTDSLRRLTEVMAPVYFQPHALSYGRALLSRLAHNSDAVEEGAACLGESYFAAWWPSRLPTLIISGDCDGVVDQTLWEDPYYTTPNVRRVVVEDAGHFPWIDQPAAVRVALSRFVSHLDSGSSST